MTEVKNGAASEQRLSVSKVIDGFLDSPLSGIAPWILLAVIGSPGHYESAIAIAFGFSIFVLWAGRRRGDRVHSLTAFGVAFFGLLLVIRVLVGANIESWLSTWTGEMSNVALATFALTTLALRKPFTMSYAKDMTPEEYWETPAFVRTNNVISAAWAAAFTLCAVFGFIGIVFLHDSGNFWTAWILQLGVTFLAAAFTEVYPDYVGAKLDMEYGQSTGPLPSLLLAVDWIPTYVLVAAVIGWIIDAVPDWLAITLIVIGIAGSAVTRRIAPVTADESSDMSDSSTGKASG